MLNIFEGKVEKEKIIEIFRSFYIHVFFSGYKNRYQAVFSFFFIF